MNLEASNTPRSSKGKTGRMRGLVLSLLTILVLAGLLASSVIGPVVADPETPGAGNTTWYKYDVDAPPMISNFSGRSLRYSPSGFPAVAYGGDHLYYSYWSGTQWLTSVVDSSPGVGAYAALAFDKSSRPRIAYYDSINLALKFAYWNGSAWVIQTVDRSMAPQQAQSIQKTNAWRERLRTDETLRDLAPSGTPADPPGVGLYVSIAIDNMNRIHLSYYDNQPELDTEEIGKLKYAYWDGGISGWKIVTVDHRNDVGSYTSIAIKSDGQPAISYMIEKYDDLRFAERAANGEWTITAVDDGDSYVGPFSSLVFDSTGLPHISYYDFGNGDLKYATRKGDGNWKLTTLDSDGDVGLGSSIAIDPDDRIVISYVDKTNDSLRLLEGPGWTSSGNLFTGHVDRFTSASIHYRNDAIASFSRPSIAYLYWATDSYTSLDLELRMATLDGGTWYDSFINRTGKVGVASSLDLDKNSWPHIAYFSDTLDNLKYAGFFKPYLAYPVYSWYYNKITDPFAGGFWPSLRLDKYGRERVAYYDSKLGGLRMAYRDYNVPFWWNTWKLLDIDYDYDVGYYPSLAIDNNDWMHFAYYDATWGDLKYAVYNWYGSIQVTRLDETGDVGKFTSMVLDINNNPYISYYDVDNHQLKLAYITQIGAWTTEVVDVLPEPPVDMDVEVYNSIALDVNGVPHITYYDPINGDLKYAYMTASGWNISIIDSVGDVGRYSSLVIDQQNMEQLCYYDGTNGDLKYAKGPAGNWTIEFVDTVGDTGLWCSLKVTNLGEPVMSYYDLLGGDLKIAASYPLPWNYKGRWSFAPMTMFHFKATPGWASPTPPTVEPTRKPDVIQGFPPGGAEITPVPPGERPPSTPAMSPTPLKP